MQFTEQNVLMMAGNKYERQNVIFHRVLLALKDAVARRR